MATSMSYNVTDCYTCCSCNRTPDSADWAPVSGLICYAASHSVAIYQPKSPARILKTLLGHTERVNCVKWIRSPAFESEVELVSASLDKTVIVWKKSGDDYEFDHRLVGHEDSVTLVTGLHIQSNQRVNDNIVSTPASPQPHRLVIASTSVDSTVRIWQRLHGQDECKCTQVISLGGGLVLSLALVSLPKINVPLLACGRDDLKVHLYVERNNQFEVAQKLSGHEEWIRGLDFTITDDSDVLLACCSQDMYIRLWRISDAANQSTELATDGLLKTKENLFNVVTAQGEQRDYIVSLESVLLGHDNWVYSVRWHPPILKDGKIHQPMNLLSASMDKTLIVWEPAAETGIWSEKVCVGEVGGGNLGFYGGMFGPEGRYILAHGYQGAFHMWSRDDKLHTHYKPAVTCGGHYSAVTDLAWDPEGQYLITVSTDQTTRLHAYWNSGQNLENSWHEIARPQVHGYDMQCIALLNRFSFVSGADEKVVRAFTAPRNFLENFRSLCGADVAEAINKLQDNKLAEGASVPALGLSNKAVYCDDSRSSAGGSVEVKKKGDQYAESSYFVAQNLIAPPSEENLLQNTLWPETQKLYGHGNEVFALACHPTGSIVASACKAAKSEHAAVILWLVDGWKELMRLESHSLTVTQMSFSHNGDWLITVSRDRTWTLYERLSAESGTDTSQWRYARVAGTDKKTALHSRIIWACSWSHDDKYFITVSRDKKAVIWGPSVEGAAAVSSEKEVERRTSWTNVVSHCCPLELSESITAVDFSPVALSADRYLIAFGLENGTIELHSWTSAKPQSQQSWTKLYHIPSSEAHHLCVRRLRFQPVTTGLSLCHSEGLHLASCGDDHTVRIYHVHRSTAAQS